MPKQRNDMPMIFNTVQFQNTISSIVVVII